MALQTLLRRVRSKAPSVTRPSDYLEGLPQFGNARPTLPNRAINWTSILVRTLNANKSFGQRGYSSEVSSIHTDNCRVSLDSSTQRAVKENDGQCDSMNGVNLGSKVSKRHNLAMIFTCTVCQTRSAKTMSRETYEKGVVIARCGGCKNLHLIADRLGWFGEPGSVEDFLNHKGVEIRKGTEESYEFSVEDLAGWSPPSKE
ncbi:hypothetical protein GOP47_0007933 [Adiantum capillus-veneris]|uniref:DNL-type domain-containing protein n=1 Tax=Adiantum capillus-veneris TaxID=13818 RepID=A0A9D4V205_ADICA|nr:hypothetical protein GOP47_0007933 [Adiantum capillus-veneris]